MSIIICKSVSNVVCNCLTVSNCAAPHNDMWNEQEHVLVQQHLKNNLLSASKLWLVSKIWGDRTGFGDSFKIRTAGRWFFFCHTVYQTCMKCDTNEQTGPSLQASYSSPLEEGERKFSILWDVTRMIHLHYVWPVLERHSINLKSLKCETSGC